MPCARKVRSLLLARLHGLLSELAETDGIELDTVAVCDGCLEVYLSIGPYRQPQPTSDTSADTDSPEPTGIPDGLKDIERNIIEALGSQSMTARQLAERAGYRLNSHFREVLASLRRRQLLNHDDDGYRLGPTVNPSV